MNSDYTPEPAIESIPPAAAKPKSIGKRATLSAVLLLSSGLALAGFGLASGTAQAEPVPVPQHPHFCDWDHGWYEDWDWDHHCHHHHDWW